MNNECEYFQNLILLKEDFISNEDEKKLNEHLKECDTCKQYEIYLSSIGLLYKKSKDKNLPEVDFENLLNNLPKKNESTLKRFITQSVEFVKDNYKPVLAYSFSLSIIFFIAINLHFEDKKARLQHFEKEQNTIQITENNQTNTLETNKNNKKIIKKSNKIQNHSIYDENRIDDNISELKEKLLTIVDYDNQDSRIEEVKNDFDELDNEINY